MDPGQLQAMVDQISKQLEAEGHAPFQFKTIPQAPHIRVGGVVASAGEIGASTARNCHVGKIVSMT